MLHKILLVLFCVQTNESHQGVLPCCSPTTGIHGHDFLFSLLNEACSKCIAYISCPDIHVSLLTSVRGKIYQVKNSRGLQLFALFLVLVSSKSVCRLLTTSFDRPRNLMRGEGRVTPSLVLSTCPLHTNSGCGKERRILIGPW